MLDALKNKKVVSVFKPLEFPIIDNKKISEDLDVSSAARQQAKKNLPDSNSKLPDSNETHFRTKFQTQLIQNSHSAQQSLNDLSAEINNISVVHEISNSKALPNEFNQKVLAEFTPRARELKEAKKRVDLADEDLEQFKTKNRLNREADYPISKVKTFGVLFIALILEAMLNGFFFAEGSDTGLLGGVGIALMIAAVNISFGYLLGWLVLPFKNHIVRWKSNLAIVLTLSFTLVVALGNLFVAHYREAMNADPDNAAAYLVESIGRGLFSVSDLNSWLLFAVGIIFYILALYKGYNSDDSYPGYGKFARIRDNALEQLQEDKELLLEYIDEEYVEAECQLEDNYDYIKKQNVNLSNYINSFENQDTIFKNYCRHVESALMYITKLYRDTNAAERNTPPPSYFETNFDFGLEFEALTLSYEDKRSELSKAKDDLEQLLPGLKDELLKVKQHFHQRVDEVCHS